MGSEWHDLAWQLQQTVTLPFVGRCHTAADRSTHRQHKCSRPCTGDQHTPNWFLHNTPHHTTPSQLRCSSSHLTRQDTACVAPDRCCVPPDSWLMPVSSRPRLAVVTGKIARGLLLQTPCSTTAATAATASALSSRSRPAPPPAPAAFRGFPCTAAGAHTQSTETSSTHVKQQQQAGVGVARRHYHCA